MTAADAQNWVGLFNTAAATAGFTLTDFASFCAAVTSPNRIAALRELLTSETRPAVRRGLEAGIAEARKIEEGR